MKRLNESHKSASSDADSLFFYLIENPIRTERRLRVKALHSRLRSLPRSFLDEKSIRSFDVYGSITALHARVPKKFALFQSLTKGVL